MPLWYVDLQERTGSYELLAPKSWHWAPRRSQYSDRSGTSNIVEANEGSPVRLSILGDVLTLKFDRPSWMDSWTEGRPGKPYSLVRAPHIVPIPMSETLTNSSHCDTCKFLSGGAFTMNQIIPKSQLKITKGGEPSKYTYYGDSGTCMKSAVSVAAVHKGNWLLSFNGSF